MPADRSVADLDPVRDIDLRDALVRLLLQLPARQRTVLVLRSN
jgi:DNA-directed RNA polymerase specialized sigma24 family protein